VLTSYFAMKQQEQAILLNPEMSWLRGLLATIAAPVVEEFVYRGGLFAALRTRWGFWRAALLSALVFAIGHQQYVLNLPEMFLLGFFCALTLERTRSLLAAIMVHAAWNLLGVMTVSPWLVIPLLGAGILLWRLGGTRPEHPRRTGWKWYAAALPLIVVIGYALDAQVAWQAVMEVPLILALIVYAWRLPSGPPLLWKLYGILYPVWTVFVLWINTIPPAMQRAWQHPFLSSDPSVTLHDLGLEVLGFALVVGPVLRVIWRLASDDRAAPAWPGASPAHEEAA
jgi:hypothetical protein